MLRGILDYIRQQGDFLLRSGNAAGEGVSRYSDRVYAAEEIGDALWDLPTMGVRALKHGARPGAAKRLGLGALNFLEKGVVNPLFNIGLFGFNAGRHTLRAVGGAQAVGGAAGVLGGQIISGAAHALGTYEGVGRALLTGHVRGPAIDGWMPGWRKFGWEDTRKYAANPRIIRRYVGARVVGGIGSGFSEMLTPKVAPPTFYLGAGGDLRHANDMGVGAGYGQSVMGHNSSFNGGGHFQMTPGLGMALLDAVV